MVRYKEGVGERTTIPRVVIVGLDPTIHSVLGFQEKYGKEAGVVDPIRDCHASLAMTIKERLLLFLIIGGPAPLSPSCGFGNVSRGISEPSKPGLSKGREKRWIWPLTNGTLHNQAHLCYN